MGTNTIRRRGCVGRRGSWEPAGPFSRCGSSRDSWDCFTAAAVVVVDRFIPIVPEPKHTHTHTQRIHKPAGTKKKRFLPEMHNI